MAKLISLPRRIPLEAASYNYKESPPLWESHINGGMVSSIDPENLDLSQAVVLKNMLTRFDHISRRNGSLLFVPAKPNANKILGFFLYQKSDGSEKLVRFTKNTIHAASTATWAVLAGPVLSGTDNDRWRTTILEDRMFATNNGIDEIQEIDITANTYAHLGNAPRYKYITGFGDRVVGFSLAGGFPVSNQLGWSGNRNYGEWDPLVDRSAGSKVITLSASDSADFGRGVFSFGSVLVIIREKSIWNATLQPIATDPFNIFQTVPNIGSDSPDSIAKCANFGVVFVDTRTKAIYLYDLNSTVTVISDPIKKDFFNSVIDPNLLFSSYNAGTHEYSACVSSNISSIVKEWIFNFDSKTWSYSEYNSVSVISNLEFGSGGIAIDELVGTLDSLSGTIDSFSPVKSVTKFFGRTDGELLIDSSTVDDDNLVDFTSEFRSKHFQLPAQKRYVNRLHITYVPRFVSGNVTVEYSINNGASWILWKTVVLSAGDIDTYKYLVCKKNIMCKRFTFRITSTAGQFDLIEYAVFGDSAGENVNK